MCTDQDLPTCGEGECVMPVDGCCQYECAAVGLPCSESTWLVTPAPVTPATTPKCTMPPGFMTCMQMCDPQDVPACGKGECAKTVGCCKFECAAGNDDSKPVTPKCEMPADFSFCKKTCDPKAFPACGEGECAKTVGCCEYECAAEDHGSLPTAGCPTARCMGPPHPDCTLSTDTVFMSGPEDSLICCEEMCQYDCPPRKPPVCEPAPLMQSTCKRMCTEEDRPAACGEGECVKPVDGCCQFECAAAPTFEPGTPCDTQTKDGMCRPKPCARPECPYGEQPEVIRQLLWEDDESGRSICCMDSCKFNCPNRPPPPPPVLEMCYNDADCCDKGAKCTEKYRKRRMAYMPLDTGMRCVLRTGAVGKTIEQGCDADSAPTVTMGVPPTTTTAGTKVGQHGHDEHNHGEEEFDLSTEVKKLLVAAGVTTAVADSLVKALFASGSELEALVMPIGAAKPDMSKLLENDVFKAALDGAGVTEEQFTSAAAAYMLDPGDGKGKSPVDKGGQKNGGSTGANTGDKDEDSGMQAGVVVAIILCIMVALGLLLFVATKARGGSGGIPTAAHAAGHANPLYEATGGNPPANAPANGGYDDIPAATPGYYVANDPAANADATYSVPYGAEGETDDLSTYA